jgi:hypothetical protein
MDQQTGVERRVYIRLKVGLAVRLTRGDTTTRCSLSNISAAGAGLVTDADVNVGDSFTLHLSAARDIPCEVVRATPYEVGVEFQIDDALKRQFVEFISQGLPPNHW